LRGYLCYGSLNHRLDAVNFFLADVQGGLGPFVSVFLVTAAGWTAAQVGIALTIAGLIGICLHIPAGAVIDAARFKRAILIGAAILLSACALAIQQAPILPVVFAADVVMAILGAIFAPTVAAPRWDLFRKRRCFPGLRGNSSGTAWATSLSLPLPGPLAGWWTQRAIFFLVSVFAAASTAAVMSIPGARIDHKRARAGEFASGKPLGFSRLVTTNRSLLTLGLVASFHFASDAMLPLAGQKLSLHYPGLETALTSSLILTVQLITIPVAAAVGRKAKSWGVKPFLAIACIALIARGIIFGAVSNAAIVIAAQVLDGIAIGIWDTLLPLMLVRFVAGSGRYSASRGLLGMIQGVGGSLSNAAGGVVATTAGYSAAFGLLALCAGLTLALVALLPELHPEELQRSPAQ
jgi:MFS family permease